MEPTCGIQEDDQENQREEMTDQQGFDIDGDGRSSPWEQNLCRICMMAAIVLAFGKDALQMVV